MSVHEPRPHGSPLSLAVVAGLGISFGLLVVTAIAAATGRLSPAADSRNPVIVYDEVQHETPGAATPRDAVVEFLDAEVEDDWAASFELLSLEDKNHFLTDEDWSGNRAVMFGSLESWQWSSPEAGDGDAPRTDLVFKPDETATDGTQPGRGTVSWLLVDEDGWRVSLAGSTIEAALPSVDGVVSPQP